MSTARPGVCEELRQAADDRNGRLHASADALHVWTRRILIAALVALLFAEVNNASAATPIPTTTYTQSTTWTLAGSPYVINGDVTVASGATLTIEPGVIVKFASVYPSYRKLVVAAGGALNAIGTAASPISFTSLRDDSVGGDTGNDGPTVCTAGQGGWLEVQSSSPLNVIAYAAVRCSAHPSFANAGIRVLGSGSTLTATDVDVMKMGGSAFYVSGGSLTLTRAEIAETASVGVLVVGGGTAAIEETTLVGTDPNGGCACRGIRAEDSTVTVRRSTVRDWWQGVTLILSSSMSGGASSFLGNTIRNNSGWGVYLNANNGLPLSKQPTGHGNNIYDNGGSTPSQKQLLVYASASGLDWSNNYWGASVYWQPNAAACPNAGYLAYPGSTTDTPLSPAVVDRYLHVQPYPLPAIWCVKTHANLGGGAGYAPVSFGDGPFLPSGFSLGMPGSPWHSGGTEYAEDPVATSIGNFVHQETDLRLAGIGVPFRFTRTYNSLDGWGGSLGRGWTHNLAASLRIESGGDITLRTDDGAQMLFTKNADGSFTPPAPARASLTTSGSGYLVTRDDQVAYEFDGGGRLLSVRDRNGQGLALAYTNGKLTSVTDSANRVVGFGYDASNRLTSVTLPDNRSVAYTYNASGQLATVVDARGKTWTYSYDGNGRLTKQTDPLGHQVFRNVYDPTNGRVLEQYDGLDNKTTFAWNAATQTATITDARGKAWVDVYAHNLLVSRTNPLNETTSYTYDADGNRASVTDPRGKTTTMTYDGRGNMLTRQAPAPLSYTESWSYDGRYDVTAYTSGRGKTTSYGYDGNGNLTSITQPGGITTTFARNATTGLVTSATDPRAKTTSYGYDAGGNLTSVTTPLGNVTTMSYDSSGRLTGVVEPRGNLPGADPTDYRTSFTYDNSDRRLTVRDPYGNTTAYAYDSAGRHVSVTDAKNHTTAYGYDATNRLTSVTAPGAAVTAYEYDGVGNLTKRTAPGARITSYVYDDANRLASATSPTGRVWSYAYDAAGNPTTITVPSGGTIGYGYDELGRLVSIDYSDTTPDVGFAYDGNGNRTQMTDGAGTESYSYDDLDRLTGVIRGADSFAYGYDAAGNLTSRTYPGGRQTSYSYDDDGRLATIGSNGQTFTYGYNAAGDVTQLTYPAANGAVETRSYDRAGRVTQVQHSKSGTPIASAAYTYDAVGNPTQITRDTGAEIFTYDDRDRLTEVCYGTGCSDFIRYAYDAVGNRTTETRPTGITTYTHNLADELTQTSGPGGAITYAYDPNGNQTQAGSRTFTYNLANELASTTDAGGTTGYGYDGDGKRLTATAGSNTTGFLWDVNNVLPQLALERDSAGGTIRSYLLAGEPLSFDQTGATHHVHRDGLGSIVATSSTTGTLEWRIGYEPYGLARGETLIDPSAPASPLRYTGGYRDPTGLYHLRARQYDANVGRFDARDPLPPRPIVPYVSTYAYVDNRPTVLIDPSGMRPSQDETFCSPTGDRTGTQRSFEVVIGSAVVAGGAAIGRHSVIAGGHLVAASLASGPFAPYTATVGATLVVSGVAVTAGTAVLGGWLIKKGACGE